jgi:hypothetical protein
MSSHGLTIGLNGPTSPDGRDMLQIQQEEWGAYVGTVSIADMVREVSNRVFGTTYDSNPWCGVSDEGDVVSTIYVYPRTPYLLYQFFTSWGRLSSRYETTLELTETINFRLSASVQPDHPPLVILAAEWLDDCYAADGTVISPPFLTIEGGEIHSSAIVYGAVSVRYTTLRHTYTLNQPRRTSAIDNQYSAVVYGVYEGGINWLVLQMPPGLDTIEADEAASCGWGGELRMPDDDSQPWPVSPGGADRRTVVDYCSQTIISDEYDAL